MVADLRYFNSLEHEEYYYTDHMNAILGVYTTLDEFTDLQCDYVDQVVKCERLEKELSKSKTMSKSFEALQKHAINLELALQQCKPTTFSDSLAKTDFSKSKSVTTNNVMTILKNTNVIAPGMYKVHTKPNQTRTPQLPQDIRKTNKCVSFSTGVIPTTSVSRPRLKSNQLEDRVMPNNSQRKKARSRKPPRIFKFAMKIAKVLDSRKGNAKISNVAKVDAEKIEEIKDDAKKAELPPTSSDLSVSSVPHIQSPSILTVRILVISKPLVLTPVPETPSVAHATTLLTPSSVFTIPPVPHQTTAPIPTPPITTEAPTITTAVPESDALTVVQLRSQVPTVVEHYLGSKISDDLQKVLQRHTADLIQKYSVKPAPESSKIQKPTIDLEQESEKSALEIHKIKREQAEKQKMPKYTIKSTDKATLKEYDQKSALYQTMHENKSFNRNPANHALYHALMEALIEDENAMDKGVADTVKNHKRQHDDDDDDEDPSAGPNQGKKTKRRRTKESESSKKPSTTKETSKGKALSKSSKTGKSATTKEPIGEPTAEVEMDDAVNTAAEDVVHDANQPHDDSTQDKDKAPMQD
ncbi:hypothetical protein Tco_0516223 [Tanacetum coccineum]